MKYGRIYLYPCSNIDKDWSPFTVGTYEDVKHAGIKFQEGMKLCFYNEDADDYGRADDLLFDGVIHFSPGKGWGAVIGASIFHWESDERESAEHPS